MKRKTRMATVAGAAVFAALVGLGGVARADGGTGTNPDGTRITGGGESTNPDGTRITGAGESTNGHHEGG